MGSLVFAKNWVKQLTNLIFSGGGGDDVLTGTILVWPATSIPAGYLECNGQSVLRASFPALFAFIGTAFGSVDADHFSLPDLRARTIFGPSPGGLGPDRPIAFNGGDVGGEQVHLLTGGESGLPATTIPNLAVDDLGAGPGGDTATLVAGGSGGGTIPWSFPLLAAADAVSPHNTMSPFMALPWIMKT